MGAAEQDSALHARHAIADKVRQRRTAERLTQEELAVIAGISYPALRKIEAGGAIPGGESLMRLAGALACRVEDLMPDRYDTLFTSPALEHLRRRDGLPLVATADAPSQRGSRSSRPSSMSSKADRSPGSSRKPAAKGPKVGKRPAQATFPTHRCVQLAA